MAERGLTIVRRIRSLLGADAAVETDATGMPRVAPRSEEAVAAVLTAASEAGWRVRVEGTGSWMPPDADADLAVTTRNLTAITYLDAADLVATGEAGAVWGDFRRALADRGAWLALDPPGSGRSVGSVVATGTAGPLRGGFGNVRDHLLGLTLVTGDGRIVRPGGRVVKNVAGFDITKLAVGSFGARPGDPGVRDHPGGDGAALAHRGPGERLDARGAADRRGPGGPGDAGRGGRGRLNGPHRAAGT
jgi:glycolate oxidase FAD binding subunit